MTVTNWASLTGALQQLIELQIFETSEMSQNLVFRSAGNVFTDADIHTFNHLMSNLKLDAQRLLAVLKRTAPDPYAEVGLAVRLPVTRTLPELKASVDALVRFNEAVKLTNAELEFGGFDVGSYWVQLLSTLRDATANLVIGALVKAAFDYALKKIDADKLLAGVSAKLGGRIPAELEEVTQKELEEGLTQALKDICSHHQLKVDDHERLRRAELGIRELARIIEHGGEVRGLLTVNSEGAPSRTPDPPVPQLDVKSTPLLPPGSKQEETKDDPARQEESKDDPESEDGGKGSSGDG